MRFSRRRFLEDQAFVLINVRLALRGYVFIAPPLQTAASSFGGSHRNFTLRNHSHGRVNSLRVVSSVQHHNRGIPQFGIKLLERKPSDPSCFPAAGPLMAYESSSSAARTR